MHPALFPFSQPKTSHQSSKLHQIPIALSFADVPCGIPSLLCFAITGPVIAIRMPQHAPTPSTALARPEFWHRNHQHSLGTIVVGSPSQDLCIPSHLELSQSYADAIQALQTERLSVDLSCWWSFQEMLGCLKCHKQAMMKTTKMMEIH